MDMMLVGFNGRPVVGGAGIKAPVVMDRTGGLYAISRSDGPGRWWTKPELDSYEDRGLLTRVSTEARYDASAVAVYAHLEFIAPDAESLAGVNANSAPLAIPTEFVLYPRLRSYVAFVQSEKAFSYLRQWAQRLVDSARNALSLSELTPEARGRVVFTEAMRARFPLAGLSDEASKAVRFDSCVLAWVGAFLQGRSLSGAGSRC